MSRGLSVEKRTQRIRAVVLKYGVRFVQIQYTGTLGLLTFTGTLDTSCTGGYNGFISSLVVDSCWMANNHTAGPRLDGMLQQIAV